MRRRKLLLALAALAVGLACIGLVLFSSSSVPAISVRLVKSIRSGDVVSATFEITNHTSNFYVIQPTGVEVRNGAGWQRSNQFGFIGGNVLREHNCATCTYEMTNPPTGCALRLALMAHKRFTGFDGFVKRLQMHGQNGVSLNPFDTRSKAFFLPTAITSETFTLPPSPPSPQRSPSAESDGLK